MNEGLPFISCKCITYGRVHTLEEAIQSFIIQDYPKDRCELVIVNDYPLQKLSLDIPNIKIINLNETFSTIGEKENFAIERCKGDIIAVWDDDDIALPHHLLNIAKHFHNEANLLHWKKGIFVENNKIKKLMSIGNSGIVYTKRVWEEIGRSPLENAGGDMTLIVKIHNLGREKVVLAEPEDQECTWMYRWGGDDVYHQSGMGTDTPNRPNIIERHKMHIEQRRKEGRIPTGTITLNPHWKRDYSLMLKEYITKNQELR
jgi:glycosyltransferase involved in cell wall biosynthesis